MKITRCLEVAVRFVSPNHQGVRVRFSHGDTRAQHLKIENDGSTLSIKFVDKDDDAVQELIYNFAQVLEYNCEGYVKAHGSDT